MTAFKEGFSEQVKSIKETTKSENSTENSSENSNVGSNGIIRVFAHDESRFGLMPITRRRITLEGIKPSNHFRSSLKATIFMEQWNH